MKKEKISSITYLVVFILTVVIIGLFSFKNLVNFYVNDEVDYNEWSSDLGSKFETDVATTFFEKFQFVNINGAFRNILGQHEMNGVVKLNNGYLLTTINYVDDEPLKNYASNVAAFKQYLENRGTSSVFAMTPYTSGKYDSQLPEGISDFGNDNANRLVSFVSDAGIDTIDFRDTMYEEGIDHYDMMYKTDHHWNTEAGFYAYCKLEDYIVSETGCEVDSRISNIDNYTITTYENWHLGSRGQRTGKYFAGVDDFDLIVPNFETSIQRDDGTIGNMQDIVYNLEPLSSKDYTSRYTYDNVLNASLAHYVNTDCNNDIKILIVSDSYAKSVCPYLMMGFSEIRFVYDNDVSGINPEFIEVYDPDVVILMYYLGSAMSDGAYSFQGFSE